MIEINYVFDDTLVTISARAVNCEKKSSVPDQGGGKKNSTLPLGSDRPRALMNGLKSYP
jgi:hypothetical protein